MECTPLAQYRNQAQHLINRYNKKSLVSSLAEQILGSQTGIYSLRLGQDYASDASTL